MQRSDPPRTAVGSESPGALAPPVQGSSDLPLGQSYRFQDERLKVLSLVGIPAWIALAGLSFGSSTPLWSISTLLDVFIATCGLLLLAYAFCTTFTVEVQPANTNLAVRARLLWFSYLTKTVSLDGVSKFELEWDDQFGFLQPILRRQRIHPVSAQYWDGRRELILQAKNRDGAAEIAAYLSDVALGSTATPASGGAAHAARSLSSRTDRHSDVS